MFTLGTQRMKRLACGCVLLALLPNWDAVAQSARPTNLPNPEVAFPEFFPGDSKTVPLDQFPAEGKAFVSHGNTSILASKKRSPAGTTYRHIEATEQEIAGPKGAIGSDLQKQIPKSTLKVRSSALEASPLEKLTLLGEKADSPTGQQAPSRLVRVFSDDERIIYLREWSLSAEGGSVIQIADYVNCAVNGAPAVLAARSHPKAGAYWTLNWSKNSIDYELGLFEPNLSPDSADKLMGIATTIR